jgi:hypothetical protein
MSVEVKDYLLRSQLEQGDISMKSVAEKMEYISKSTASSVQIIEVISKSTTTALFKMGIKGMSLINSARHSFTQQLAARSNENSKSNQSSIHRIIDSARRDSERGDVPGWVLVVLMTTGLVTAIWTIAAPRLSAILKNSLDAMNGIR